MMNQQYQEMFTKFQEGRITTQEWVSYCETLLVEIMWQNRKIFVRLKNRA